MKRYIAHNEATNTIRMFPENYLVAVNHNGRWLLDADSAICDEAISRFAVTIRACQYTPLDIMIGKLNVDLNALGSDNDD